jgi:hypothetical protein
VAAKGKARANKNRRQDGSKLTIRNSTESSGNQSKFLTAARGPVALCAAFEKIPLDSGAVFIDAALRLLLYSTLTAESQRNAELRREDLQCKPLPKV